ncbi:MAG: HAD hydrolase-like protein [Taibaiella sp.]|nr:HAD hydrolase-like protein [Taibaiella sp.]
MHSDRGAGEIKALFLDIGGVLLTNGWGHESRYLAIEKFGLNKAEVEDRHNLAFETYEVGKMTLDEYLDLVVFYEPRNFSHEDFKKFMFEQSQLLDATIEFFKEIKNKYKLKVIAVSNEGRELNEYRINQFKLDELFDAYISSCYVHLHKPDMEMLKMACDISHISAEHALYVDDRLMLASLAKDFGLNVLHFKGLDDAREFIKTVHFINS